MRSQGCQRRALEARLGRSANIRCERNTDHEDKPRHQPRRTPSWLRKLIPPPEAVVLPIIGRTPTPTVPRTVSARAIFVQADIRHLSLHWVIVTRISASNAARCVACHGVRSHPVPVALVGEMPTATCPMPDQGSSQVPGAWSERSYEG
jgi:hypothetical protein